MSASRKLSYYPKLNSTFITWVIKAHGSTVSAFFVSSGKYGFCKKKNKIKCCSEMITVVIKSHPEGNMSVCAKFHDGGCWMMQ